MRVRKKRRRRPRDALELDAENSTRLDKEPAAWEQTDVVRFEEKVKGMAIEKFLLDLPLDVL
jgi:hypothetical protein